ncbi:MAG: cytochrome b/b6 domain-containing protein [Gammaproteobacteria bacterium]|nr:cytochrome b/b6 domain-containing protein [Gammaproteobacteria bacterium]MBU1483018.1 cytochrome b/b6 domain-containing protein [Gammaproteobacteria bacterium]
MKQYSKRTSILHWLIFLLVVAAFFLGHYLADLENTPEKLSLLPVHFLIGDTILVLTLLRIYFRKKDGEPAPANANPLLNKIAAATHSLLNLSLIAAAIAGIATVATSGVIEVLKKGDPSLLPDFEKVGAREVHEIFIGVMLLLLVFHVVAALYHQFIVRDNLMHRIRIKRFKE